MVSIRRFPKKVVHKIESAKSKQLMKRMQLNSSERSHPPLEDVQNSTIQERSSIEKQKSILQSNNREELDFDGIQYSLYYLSSRDNPRISLIPEVRTGMKYNTWNLTITIALEVKNKLVFIDGSLPRPERWHPHHKILDVCNSMVKSWILNSVTKKIYGSILRFNDASKIWRDLLRRFHITSLPHAYQITQQTASLQQGSLNLSTYYTKLKTLWDDLEASNSVRICGYCQCCKGMSSRSENNKMINFLAGLNESYANARGQIIMKKNIPNLMEVYNLLDQDYSHRSTQNTHPLYAFQVSGSDGENASQVNVSYSGQKSQQPICSRCGYTGHMIDKCYKIYGYPPGFKHKKKTSIVKHVVAQLALTSLTEIERGDTSQLITISRDQSKE